VPWAGLQAVEIQHEVVQLGRGLDLSSPRVSSDPFNTVLKYGLSRNPDDRRLSVEQIHDLLAERLLVNTSHYHNVPNIVVTSLSLPSYKSVTQFSTLTLNQLSSSPSPS